MQKKSIAAACRQIDAQIKRIGVERDKLDDMISSAADLLEGCYEAAESLQRARDALSRIV